MFLRDVRKNKMLKRIIGKIWRTAPSSIRALAVRITQKTFTVSVGAIVLDEAGKVLLLDHVFRPASGWGIPGGFINQGEQPVDAVRRELCEEIGLEIEAVELFRVRTINRHVEILFRAQARRRGGQAAAAAVVKSLEIKAVGWFSADELPEEMSRSQKHFIKQVLEG
jgi:ADP-ribose pyrophosphatase YjhB (NUDIX family)